MSHTKFVVTVTKPAAGLAQSPGQQQQLAQRLGVIDVMLVILPFAIDLVGPDQGGRVVTLDHAAVLRAQVKSLCHALEHAAKGLLAQLVERAGLPRRIE